MPSIYRSFQDLLVVQISHKLTKYWTHYCVLCQNQNYHDFAYAFKEERNKGKNYDEASGAG